MDIILDLNKIQKFVVEIDKIKVNISKSLQI